MQYYEGDPNSFPETFLIPDDSDPPQAAVVNVANEALGDRTAWLRANLPRMKAHTYTANGTWTAPERCTRGLLIGYGGGGAGGAGVAGSTPDNTFAPGGGGGGGALEATSVVTVVPGETYQVLIGAGGTAPGGDGQDTVFQKLGDPALAVFGGAAGGLSAITTYAATNIVLVRGGPAMSAGGIAEGIEPIVMTTAPPVIMHTAEGHGGYGTGPSTPATWIRRGAASRRNWSGGAAGNTGTAGGAKREGGPGGGGGAGPGGNGGTGGNAGNGNGAGAGAAGGAGQSAAANSGAGGGGGGGGGHGTTGTPAGGAGGNGGSGRLTVIWIEE